jgi:nucleoside 2-deoxyribosyltransferase
MFAIVDGLDAGTVYEIGYARALGKPVIVYCESEAPEPLKMMTGSDCFVVPDFVSALYKTSWVAISQ